MLYFGLGCPSALRGTHFPVSFVAFLNHQYVVGNMPLQNKATFKQPIPKLVLLQDHVNTNLFAYYIIYNTSTQSKKDFIQNTKPKTKVNIINWTTAYKHEHCGTRFQHRLTSGHKPQIRWIYWNIFGAPVLSNCGYLHGLEQASIIKGVTIVYL